LVAGVWEFFDLVQGGLHDSAKPRVSRVFPSSRRAAQWAPPEIIVSDQSTTPEGGHGRFASKADIASRSIAFSALASSVLAQTTAAVGIVAHSPYLLTSTSEIEQWLGVQ